LPRLIASTIRAYDVQKLTRSAQYIPPIDYAAEDVFSDEEIAKAEGDKKNPLAVKGFVHVPATGTHGGVVAGSSGVRREAIFSFGALRTYCTAGQDKPKTEALQRYILGLSLVALTAPLPTYLRQGCDLVPDTDKPREFLLVHSDGRREPASLTHEAALAFAKEAAAKFGVGEDRAVAFDKELAKKDVTGEGDAEKSKKSKTKAAKEKK
jgi:CRISPR-associated protein Csb1